MSTFTPGCCPTWHDPQPVDGLALGQLVVLGEAPGSPERNPTEISPKLSWDGHWQVLSVKFAARAIIVVLPHDRWSVTATGHDLRLAV